MGGWEGEGMGQTDLRGSCSEAALESAVTVVGQGEAGWGWAPLRDPPCPRPRASPRSPAASSSAQAPEVRAFGGGSFQLD